MITGLAVGKKLNNKNRNRAEQQDVDEPTLVQKKFKDNPNDEKYGTNCPHSKFL